MYNSYNIEIYPEDPEYVEIVLRIALEEVRNRPTPQSYDLLVWAYFANGDTTKSLKIVQ